MNLLNIYFCRSHFPSTWKRAYIRPLLKVRAPISPSDTRPIANIPKLSKTLKRVVHKQVVNLISSNNLLDPR